MNFSETLRKEIAEWWDSDELFTDFTKRIRNKYPTEFKEWIETNLLPPKRRDELNKMFLSLLRLSTPKVKKDE